MKLLIKDLLFVVWVITVVWCLCKCDPYGPDEKYYKTAVASVKSTYKGKLNMDIYDGDVYRINCDKITNTSTVNVNLSPDSLYWNPAPFYRENTLVKIVHHPCSLYYKITVINSKEI